MRNKPAPPYARYSIWLLLWKPFRKFLNVVFIPNLPFNGLRIFFYRLLGYRIGRSVFIGMKCYLDDLNPAHLHIEDHVTISYGVYFSLHGKRQGHRKITIQSGVYIGMRANITAVKEDLVIGKNSVVGAASLVNSSVPEGVIVAGIPAKEINKI